MDPHIYSVGDLVQFTPSAHDDPMSRGVFKVIRQLPADHADQQYRVKSTRDGHERVVHQRSLAGCPTHDTSMRSKA